MEVPQGIKERLREISSEASAPPHVVRIEDAETSYADIEKREVVLARGQLKWLDWVYRHELAHLAEWPRTIARDLYYQAKALNRLPPVHKEFFKRHRAEIMNIAYDAIIDWNNGISAAVKAAVKDYVRDVPAEVRRDPNPADAARLMIAGERLFPRLKSMLEKRDVAALAIEALFWMIKHRDREATTIDSPPILGKPAERDFEEAAADLIREGEDLDGLDELAREEGVRYSEDKAALAALVKSYEWYLSASRHREVYKSGRARQGVWNPGDSPEKLDLNGSLTLFPKVIPGLTAVKREARPLEGFEEPLGFKDVALLVDESGSLAAKARAVRVVGVSILGYLNRRRVQYQVIGFGGRAIERVPLGFDYVAGVKYFAKLYNAWQSTTKITPALKLLRGRYLLVYVISDAEIFDLHRVAEYKNMLSEVVLVLINQAKRYSEFAAAFGGVRVRGYWLHPSRINDFLVEELGRLG